MDAKLEDKRKKWENAICENFMAISVNNDLHFFQQTVPKSLVVRRGARVPGTDFMKSFRP
jgi:hypothetical protein